MKRDDTKGEPLRVDTAVFSDQELMQRLIKGENHAFNFLVGRYKNKLFNLIYRLLKSREEAEDVLQETFLRVYREKENYNFDYSFSTWIYTIALNLAKNEMRRRNKFKFLDLELFKNNTELAAPENNNEDALISALEKVMDKLPERYKTVLLLREMNQLSYEEIAESVNLPLGTIKSRINRARLILRRKLKKRGSEGYALSKSTALSFLSFRQ
jgi:RNA polymerase sigma-70 factor (ECF subfamily)